MSVCASKKRQNKMSRPNPSSEARAAGLSRRLLLGLSGVLAVAPFGGARAQSRLLDAPRAAGSVGERFDGFAVVRGAPTPDVAALVEQVNAERRTIYAQRAQADKATPDAVGKVYALEILKSAPKNTWFLSEQGQWTQK